jgi:hypothetical protein
VHDAAVHVGHQSRVPASLFDVAPDLIPAAFEPLGRDAGEPAVTVHVQEAVQGHPAQHPRAGEAFAPVARLPDAIVRLLPVAADVVAELAQQRLRLTVQVAPWRTKWATASMTSP